MFYLCKTCCLHKHQCQADYSPFTAHSVVWNLKKNKIKSNVTGIFDKILHVWRNALEQKGSLSRTSAWHVFFFLHELWYAFPINCHQKCSSAAIFCEDWDSRCSRTLGISLSLHRVILSPPQLLSKTRDCCNHKTHCWCCWTRSDNQRVWVSASGSSLMDAG